jgi:predicted RNA-binding Zn ribbon-like protein
LIRSFVNTLNIEGGTDDLDTPDGLSEWLANEGGIKGTHVDEAARRRAVELREALRAILLSHNDEEVDEAGAFEALNDFARRARFAPVFGPEEVAFRPQAPGIDGALGKLIAIVVAAESDGTWSRLKACPADNCTWAFYDHARNRSGKWCDMAVCGNRTKARAFRERSRQPRSPAAKKSPPNRPSPSGMG